MKSKTITEAIATLGLSVKVTTLFRTLHVTSHFIFILTFLFHSSVS